MAKGSGFAAATADSVHWSKGEAPFGDFKSTAKCCRSLVRPGFNKNRRRKANGTPFLIISLMSET